MAWQIMERVERSTDPALPAGTVRPVFVATKAEARRRKNDAHDHRPSSERSRFSAVRVAEGSTGR